MLFLTSCLSFSLSSCKRRNGRARAHAIRTCRYSNMFEKQNSLYRLKKGAECELPEVTQTIIDMSLNASGVRNTARVLHISTDTVLRELKKKATVLESVNSALLRTINPKEI